VITLAGPEAGAPDEPEAASRRPGRPAWLTSALGIVGLLVVWQLLATFVISDSVGVPAPTEIIHKMRVDGFQFYWRNASTTVQAAFKGWMWGNALAIALAIIVLVLPFVEKPMLQLGIASYCIPVVAIGPIFAIVFNGETPKVILAAMSVFFTTLVGALVGLRSADPTSLDVVHAYGGGSIRKLTKVRLRASLPSLFSALRIAAPAAVLGAIIGEYLGAEQGLGVTMIAAQQNFDVPRTWALAFVATAAAGIAYGITAAIGRLLTPWAPKGSG
jgi:ABC-type nitrate/sulfonate/bicarbonate transport system permease component